MPPTKLSEVKTQEFTRWYERLGGVAGTTSSSSTVGSSTVPPPPETAAPVEPASPVETIPPVLKEDHVFDSSKLPVWDPNEPLPPLDVVPEGFSWRYNPPPMPDVASKGLKIRSHEEIKEGIADMLETTIVLPPPTETPNAAVRKTEASINAAKKRRGKPGIVIGKQSENIVNQQKGEKINFPFSQWHSGPENAEVHKMICRDVGAVIRERILMVASNFIELGNQQMKIVFDFVFTMYKLPERNAYKQIVYVMKLAELRYCNWKTRIRAWTNANEIDKVPDEFISRVREWKWLQYHFHDPRYLKKSEQNKINRVEKTVNHHSGATDYRYLVQKHLKLGSDVPLIDVWGEMYPDQHEKLNIMKDTATKKHNLLTLQSCVESSPSVSESVEVDGSDAANTANTCLAIQPHSLEWTWIHLEILGDHLGRQKGVQDQRGTTNAFSHPVPHKQHTSSQRSAEVEALKAKIE